MSQSELVSKTIKLNLPLRFGSFFLHVVQQLFSDCFSDNFPPTDITVVWYWQNLYSGIINYPEFLSTNTRRKKNWGFTQIWRNLPYSHYLFILVRYLGLYLRTQSCTHAFTLLCILAPLASSLHIEEKVKANGKAPAKSRMRVFWELGR